MACRGDAMKSEKGVCKIQKRSPARIGCALGGLLLLASTMITAAADDYHASGYEIKAAYLLKFPNFVEWPGNPNADEKPITVCLLGQDALGSTLSRMMADH